MNTRMLVAGALWLTALGCGSARRDEPLTGPQQLASPAVMQGQRVFFANCNGCHPGGTQGLAPAIHNKSLPRWLIRFQVRNGLGDMPAFSDEELSSEDLDALVDYLVWVRRLDVRDSVAVMGR